MKSIFLCQNPQETKRIYSQNIINSLKSEASLADGVFTKEDIFKFPEKFIHVENIFSTWGMPVLTEDEIKKYLPSLKSIFYAAGTVQAFARPFLKCNVRIFSAWAANAIPVAEYAAAQIVLANKGFYALSKARKSHKLDVNDFPGNYGVNVGLIGAGTIGKLVIKFLKNQNINVNILVFDPFLPDEEAKTLGVKKVTLEEIFSNCSVISNHLANNEKTKNMLNYKLFSMVGKNATFINTGKGAQVVEKDLIKVLKQKPDFTAILDVTMPDPPSDDSEFFTLDNCILTPHIAGSHGKEVHRMAEYMLNEFRLYKDNKPCNYEVTEKMLETMA